MRVGSPLVGLGLRQAHFIWLRCAATGSRSARKGSGAKVATRFDGALQRPIDPTPPFPLFTSAPSLTLGGGMGPTVPDVAVEQTEVSMSRAKMALVNTRPVFRGP